MNAHTESHRTGPSRSAALLRVLLMATAAAPMLGGWGRDAHELVSREALEALPPPLSTRLTQEEVLKAILHASNGPDRRSGQAKDEAKRLSEAAEAAVDEKDKSKKQAEADAAWRRYRIERSKHFFDIDAMTDQAAPYDSFPRERKAAALQAAEFLIKHRADLAAELLGEKGGAELDPADKSRWPQLGEAALEKFGTLPWAIRDQVKRLETIFRECDFDGLPEAIGDLSHYVADLHQPLHTTRNYNGQLTGNLGVHGMFETYMIVRQKALGPQRYDHLPPQYLQPYDAVDDVLKLVFERIGENAAETGKLLAADTAARRKSQVTDEDMKYLKSLDDHAADELFRRKDTRRLDARQKRLVLHADQLHKILTERYDDLPRRRLAKTASMLASLVYTAWLEADRPPLEAHRAAKTNAAPRRMISWEMAVVGAIAAMLLVALLRRRVRPPRAE